MFWRKKKEPTLTEQTVTAIDRIHTEVYELNEERVCALNTLSAVTDWLGEVNTELSERFNLCSALMAQLATAQSNIQNQIDANVATFDGIKNVLDLGTNEK